MTIRPGAEWGRMVPRPAGLRRVGSDRRLARSLAAGATALQLTGGDLHRTLGSPTASTAGEVRALPIDVLEVVVDDGAPQIAVAHVVLRSPWWRGGPLRGPVVMVMNAEFIGDWDVAPRGHPDDGRAEVVEVAADLGVRARLAARRRLPRATHVPHPSITTRSVRTATWESRRPFVVALDGETLGRCHHIEVSVAPDAAIVHV
jgi:hypothetical protein